MSGSVSQRRLATIGALFALVMLASFYAVVHGAVDRAVARRVADAAQPAPVVRSANASRTSNALRRAVTLAAVNN